MDDKLPEMIDVTKPRASIASIPEAACGIGSCRPRFLQKLASPKIFLANFALIATMRSAYFVYLMSVMSTLEKRFAFPSKLSALIMIADNISGMIVSPIIGYVGIKLNRPVLIGFGTVLVGLSSITSGLPYLIYGPGTHLLQGVTLVKSLTKTYQNSTKFDVCDTELEACSEEGPHNFAFGAYAFLWMGSFINGLGNTAIWTIGVPYMDDNIAKKNSPIYLSATTVVRYSGVMFGYFIASFSLRFYEDPTVDVNIPRNDPRFIGAWWMGFFIIGICLLITSIPMFMFPISMKGERRKEKKTEKMSFRDAFTTFKRVASNPVLAFDTIGGALRVTGWAGYYITKPRYIEAQFRQSASSASFLTGTTSSVLKVIGIFAGGLTISFVKPKPKKLITYIVIVDLLCNGFILAGFFIKCPQQEFGNIHMNGSRASLWDKCNDGCTCSQSVFQPVCASDGKTNYFSPCFAGCTSSEQSSNQTIFQNCACRDGPDDYLTSGYCPQECGIDNLVLYLGVIGISGIISSTTWTGNALIALRAVDQKDKSFAMGLIGSFMSLFAYIPYPIIFGFVADFSCRIWEESCGETGNCWLYDLDKFRYYLHGTSFALLMLGSFFDMGILFFADRLNDMYDDDVPEQQEMTKAKRAEKAEEDENTLFDVTHDGEKFQYPPKYENERSVDE
ncbi:solute carrier organic anion transporter family member 74D-like [Brevipalpus obovatus]|uniref:solute carrier organic anion transporter family member 74D-like n=1 Tax=Brevipalpus obovatus TaxID=246614 RepID=UPI003D9E298D